MKRTVVPFLCLGVLAACAPQTEDPAPAGPQRTACALTVYSHGRALVKDTRRFDLDAGINTVRFDDVTSGIVPGSVRVEAADGTELAVYEQNVQYDLVSTERLLQRYLGQDVRVTTEDGDIVVGTLLSSGGDLILEDAGGGVVVLRADGVRDIEFPELPQGLASRPALVWTLESPADGARDVTVTYVSSGFDWSADYVVQLAEDDDTVDLSGWISVSNDTEATFDDARLKLVAGDVLMVPVGEIAGGGGLGADAAAFLDSAASARQGYGAGPPQERSFFDYHLYDVPRPVTVNARESKQIEFTSVRDVPAEVTYEMSFDGWWRGDTETRHPTISVDITNGEEQKLGIPLPAGVVRVYKKDVDGASELVGESRIEHTPRDEEITLAVGEAFDIVGEWRQLRHRVIGDWADQYDYEVVVRNHKHDPVTVTVKHQPYHWGEWTVVKASVDHTRPDNAHVEFEVEVPADGETRMTYTIRNRW